MMIIMYTTITSFIYVMVSHDNKLGLLPSLTTLILRLTYFLYNIQWYIMIIMEMAVFLCWLVTCFYTFMEF